MRHPPNLSSVMKRTVSKLGGHARARKQRGRQCPGAIMDESAGGAEPDSGLACDEMSPTPLGYAYLFPSLRYSVVLLALIGASRASGDGKTYLPPPTIRCSDVTSFEEFERMFSPETFRCIPPTRLTYSDMVSVALSDRDGIRGCLERAVAREPERTGIVVLRLIVSPEGVLREVTVQTKAFENSVFVRCISARIRSWKFPSREVSEPVEFALTVQSMQVVPGPQPEESKPNAQ
jgi:hypothetical protein